MELVSLEKALRYIRNYGKKLYPRHLEKTFKKCVKEGKNTKITIHYKQYLKDEHGNIRPSMLYSIIDNIFTQQGTMEVWSLFGDINAYLFPKPSALIQIFCEATSKEDAYILDFFAGSGITAHAAINVNREDGGNRKYIMVEMADHFNTVMLPRIKKVVFSDKWKDGNAQNGDGISHFLKYYKLEQYEDTLRKAKYDDADLFENPYQEPYNQYVFMLDLKMLEALEVDVKENKVNVDLSKLYDSIDIAETLSNLRGKWIKRIGPDFVEFEDGEKVDIKNLDYRLIKPLIWW